MTRVHLALSFTIPLLVTACQTGDDDGIDVESPLTDPEDGPPAGNPDGDCAVPADAGPEDVSTPRTVVGDGRPESCTGDAFIEAVKAAAQEMKEKT